MPQKNAPKALQSSCLNNDNQHSASSLRANAKKLSPVASRTSPAVPSPTLAKALRPDRAPPTPRQNPGRRDILRPLSRHASFNYHSLTFLSYIFSICFVNKKLSRKEIENKQKLNRN